MIQYAINATAIWLLSLLIFELFLRRTTHHAYNRVYLVFTALLGALMPLYPTSSGTPGMSTVLEKPIIAVTSVQRDIAAAATAPQYELPWLSWLLWIYLLGVAATLGALLREALMLLRWYRTAEIRSSNGLKLVVTRRGHGPFSLFGMLFISDPERYSAAELRFILRHEGVHIRHRHHVDKLLLLLLRCLLWPNPLAYVYYHRLMMVHEFEADEAGRPQLHAYGGFLLEQHLNSGIPALAH